MSIIESMSVAVFMMFAVFSVLIGLYLCIRVFSLLCARLENQKRRADG